MLMTAISIVLGVVVALAASPIVAEWYRGLRREGTLGNGELVEKLFQRIAASEPMVPRSCRVATYEQVGDGGGA